MKKDQEGSMTLERAGVFKIILDSIADGVFTVDRDWRITYFNRAAERITGVSRREAVGQLCRDVLKADTCERHCCLRTTMNTGQPIVDKGVYIIDARGRRVALKISTALLRDEEGRILGGVETFRDVTVEEDLRKAISARYTFGDIVSRNEKILALMKILPDVAQTSSTVLIEGESGTGKELFARAIHRLSPRRRFPFVAVNCAALPDTLLESELFGYKAGAFTDAKRDKPGRFQLAQNGTLFLDEIGDISPAMQVRLLRVLQEKTFEPLGSTESVRHNARVIAATNRDLADLVARGLFREDLYWRINVFKITLPPLRERMEDVPLLVERFIAHFNTLQDKNVTGVSEEAMRVLMSHDYPGNVRELANIIEGAFILCKGGLIEKKHLPVFTPGRRAGTVPAGRSLDDTLAVCLREALAASGGNVAKAARQLGIHRSTLYRKMKALGLKPLT
ncbi:MAG TPA: sigma 54-interacting transcriptional regulator [Syntrophales bacterium]|nr:sigma 54-interacting transcriptional regulator [Syntrophales bacterium]HRV41929.1 sigma 54-interacting transcriptional regulator [Syntrophales bacterium]